MVSLPGASPFEVAAIWTVLVIAFFGLAYALFLRRQVMACDKGTEKMQDVWDGIRPVSYTHLTLPTSREV